ncbi:tetratricopeptide repeat protein [Chitinophaga filiformis]|uniref:Uncharacterized protein n=1 Tax=Chitinophaga filiformis TaxID=104663 RepID=A0A1G7ZVJ0_CHIFI|nr:hypothetical protein [Chitinophaga filiformis]SDH12663.1 hypothetical protein SAMN04488121_10912 [Chitinophaga filiformis]
MRAFITLVLVLLTTGLMAQGETDWKQSLKEELTQLDKTTDFTTWQQGAEKIGNLAAAHPEEWLLQYYTGWAYTQSSFKAPEGEADPSTEKAEPYVKKALHLQPDNTETLTLMAYWLSARINARNSRGMSLGPDSRSYSDKAIKADSANPRAYLMKALVVYHTPALFGGGKKKAAPIVEEAGQRFADFKPKDELEPHWGSDIFKELEKELEGEN